MRAAVRYVLKLCIITVVLAPVRCRTYASSAACNEHGTLTVSVPESNHVLGVFDVALNETQLRITVSSSSSSSSLEDGSSANTAIVVWESVPGENFVTGGEADMTATEQRGSFRVRENVSTRRAHQTIDSVSFDSISNTLRMSGTVSSSSSSSSAMRDTDEPSDKDASATSVAYVFVLESNELDSSGHLRFDLSFSDPTVNYLELVFRRDSRERFYGFGEQYSYLNLAGKEVPILSQEQGIGRGNRLVTPIVDLASNGSGGTPFTTYYSSPHFLTDQRRGFLLENTEYSVFDLRRPPRRTTSLVEEVLEGLSLVNHDDDEDVLEHAVRVRLFAPRTSGRMLHGESGPLELVQRLTERTGRMKVPPDWLNRGAVVGVQGGTDFVRTVHEELRTRDAPVSAFWLQDWVGRRLNSIGGSQLWWNWEVDYDWYPQWDELVAELQESNITVMGYVSTFLVDASSKGNVRRNLYKEASELGYLVTDEKGETYFVTNTDFDAGMLDLTNPGATEWFQEVVQTQLIDEGGLNGWMADYGEALPFDGKLHSGVDAATFHNAYPVEWARVNREAIEREFNSSGKELVFFMRAGYTTSPTYSTMFWGGDQLVTFDCFDGMKSAITSLLSGGYSGMTLHHSDVGGYTSFHLVGPVSLTRSRELFMRWLEMNTFTSVLRTHEGFTPENNVQFYTDSETLDAFSYFAKIYSALAPYRRTLFEEAEALGYPVVRHLGMHYPDDEISHDAEYQFLLGSDVLVAPVVEKSACKRDVYLPLGNWVHLWSGKLYQNNMKGITTTVYSPISQPPVFYIQGSEVGATLATFLADIRDK